MRLTLFLLVILCSVSISHGQKITINVNQDSVTFSANGEFVSYPYKIRNDDVEDVYVIWKKGYVNQGFIYNDIAQKGRKTHAIELERINFLEQDYDSKIIVMHAVEDKSVMRRISERIYSDPFILQQLKERLVSFGYTNTVVANSNEAKDAQLKIAADIVEFSKNTKGGYFQVSILVTWSVYNVLEDKLVLQVKTAGYSNTESVFIKDLSYALRNSLIGLMSNTDFQTLAEQTN